MALGRRVDSSSTEPRRHTRTYSQVMSLSNCLPRIAGAMLSLASLLNAQPTSACFPDNALLVLRSRRVRHGCCADLHRSTRHQRLRGSLAADVPSWCLELYQSQASAPAPTP